MSSEVVHFEIERPALGDAVKLGNWDVTTRHLDM